MSHSSSSEWSTSAGQAWWYGACNKCTAKWFSHRRTKECPRCGGSCFEPTQARPPWLSGTPSIGQANTAGPTTAEKSVS